MEQKEYYSIVCLKKNLETNVYEDVIRINFKSENKEEAEKYCEYLNNEKNTSDRYYKIMKSRTHKRNGSR